MTHQEDWRAGGGLRTTGRQKQISIHVGEFCDEEVLLTFFPIFGGSIFPLPDGIVGKDSQGMG